MTVYALGGRCWACRVDLLWSDGEVTVARAPESLASGRAAYWWVHVGGQRCQGGPMAGERHPAGPGPWPGNVAALLTRLGARGGT